MQRFSITSCVPAIKYVVAFPRIHIFPKGEKKPPLRWKDSPILCERINIKDMEDMERQKIDLTNNKKWRGSVGGLVDAPMNKVWTIVSRSCRLHEWMPMVERCTDLAGEEGVPGYIRLVSGFMFPQEDGDRSWIKERLVAMDPSSYSYVYKMEASNVGLDGSVNSLKLVEYGDDSTLVDWSFEINPVEGASEDYTIDYLVFLYKSCIKRIVGAIEATDGKIK